ncbi:hypothetical protein SM124_14105 [Bacillus sp. 31A1R]|uniref:Uncharacterized protein n=1 Tax=Robertmurraya mangrovi TaxID=3098077 RepID=A0ABU5J0H7_9BACI|nr:hypothetical protein [Bacillus sp. 31A1R]MDZ5472862.1 hypothetical protein [Bacillus sp. 31A1R]
MMKKFKLRKAFKKKYKKGQFFYLVSESEFIGVKEFVFRTEDLTERIVVTQKEFGDYFIFVEDIRSFEKLDY